MQAALDDWNDLRLVLAVGRAGGLAAAARALGVDHSTVFRRLQGVEARFGLPLFERGPGGTYTPTDAGDRLLAAAERVEDEVLGTLRDVAGRDRRLTGRLRVTSSETLAYRLLTRHIAAFRLAHPGIVVELVVDNRVLNLSRREADMALRPLRPRESDLWGRRLADVAWAVYGARDLLDRRGGPQVLAEISKWPMIGWEDGAAGIAAADWVTRTVPPASVVFRTSSLVNQLVAARAGIGLAVLPCYLGDPELTLGRAWPAPLADLASELWIVTHADLRRTARVRAFFDVLADGIDADRPLVEGRSGQTHPGGPAAAVGIR